MILRQEAGLPREKGRMVFRWKFQRFSHDAVVWYFAGAIVGVSSVYRCLYEMRKPDERLLKQHTTIIQVFQVEVAKPCCSVGTYGKIAKYTLLVSTI